jgi:DNA polymerase-1
MATARDPSVILIDGYALIYRAFFAMMSRPLRTSRGENTSAVWGVANVLHRLFEQYRPTLVGWVHDSGTSFRDELYPAYKATREKLDEELREDFERSLERVETLLKCWGVPLVAEPGFEADDVIGTLAARASAAGLQVVIVSGDKDFYQLIDPRVALLNPGRGGPTGIEEQWVDLENAGERLGVPPERVVDYLALVGDASDNVPGVKGIGEKTARQLIAEYGDLDTILRHAGEVSNKRAREALLRDAENARLSRELVTIRRDVPGVSLDALELGRRDPQALAQLYAELEFHTLIPKLERDAAPAADRPTVVVATLDALRDAVARARSGGMIGLALSAVGGNAMRAELRGLSICLPGGEAWYFPFEHVTPGDLTAMLEPRRNLPGLEAPEMAPLRALLESADVRKVTHDAKWATVLLRRRGITCRGVSFDTMLASFVIDPGRRAHTLDVLAREYLNSELPRLGGSDADAPATIDEVALAGGARVRATLALRERMGPELEERRGRTLLEELELPLVPVLADMEWHGVGLDRDRLRELSQTFGTVEAELERQIYRESGTEFNLNSTPQLRHVLFEKLQLPVLKRTKTGASTDADVLGELAAAGHRVPQLLLEYREVAKLRSTYLDVLPACVHSETDRIHSSFSQTGAATGRLSSSDPNLQNIPVRTARGGEIRRCFVPRPGWVLIVADYSQIELRLLAHLSSDPEFVAAFKRGGDVHRETAATIFGVEPAAVTAEMRARAKTINFATIYGQGPFSLARQLGISLDEAKRFIDVYFERFAGVRRFLDACIERAREVGYSETIFGRRRYIPELRDRNRSIRSFGERVAMNSPLQGSAADVIKRAMIGLHAALRDQDLSSHLILQVHDELVVEAPAAETERARDLVRREMETAVTLTVPLVVDIGVGTNWFDAKP